MYVTKRKFKKIYISGVFNFVHEFIYIYYNFMLDIDI